MAKTERRRRSMARVRASIAKLRGRVRQSTATTSEMSY